MPPLIFALEANTLAWADGATVARASVSASPPIIALQGKCCGDFMVLMFQLRAFELRYEFMAHDGRRFSTSRKRGKDYSGITRWQRGQ